MRLLLLLPVFIDLPVETDGPREEVDPPDDLAENVKPRHGK
jgi:hypothetical protein